MSNSYFCSECGEDQSQFDHAFYHCHQCGECVIFDPQKVIAAHAENPEEKIFIGHNFTALPESDLYPEAETLTTDLEDRPERYAQLDCILCCDCANGHTLKNHGPDWVREREE